MRLAAAETEGGKLANPGLARAQGAFHRGWVGRSGRSSQGAGQANPERRRSFGSPPARNAVSGLVASATSLLRHQSAFQASRPARTAAAKALAMSSGFSAAAMALLTRTASPPISIVRAASEGDAGRRLR